MVRRNLIIVVALAALLFCTGCATVYMDQVQVAPNARLVVGVKQAFGGAKKKVWLIENGQVTEIQVVGGD